jgi:hypothetical protein
MVGIAAMFSVFIIVAAGHRDQSIVVRYDCALLVGGWHPDFPKEAQEACRKKGIYYDRSKTSY